LRSKHALSDELHQHKRFIPDGIRIVQVIEQIAAPSLRYGNDAPDRSVNFAAFRVYNIGAYGQVKLIPLIKINEGAQGKDA